MKEIIIYGAGTRCIRLCQLLQRSNTDIRYIVDSVPEKWGAEVCGVFVSPPDVLYQDTTAPVCIAIADPVQESAIRDELWRVYGIDPNRVIGYWVLMYRLYAAVYGESLIWSNDAPYAQRPVCAVFDCSHGLMLGGIEAWTLDLCEGLIAAGLTDISILSDNGSYDLPDDLQVSIDKVSINKDSPMDQQNVINTALYLCSKLPCVVVAGHPNTIVLTAASIVKRKHPDQIRIISVIHNGFDLAYQQATAFVEESDLIIGVCQDIQHEMIRRGALEEKVLSMTCPFACEKELNRTYTKTGEPIRLGYAGRMEIGQKRMDLFRELILGLEQSGLNYRFQFAGDGESREMLEALVAENHLEDKVQFLGRLPREQMQTFWREQDIFLNLANMEGRCISKLEAMANGVVPIMTDTAGNREDITDGVNGYIVPLGDYTSVLKRIEYLDKNRALLPQMGTDAHQAVYPKSSREKHIEFWQDILRKQKWILLNGQ